MALPCHALQSDSRPMFGNEASIGIAPIVTWFAVKRTRLCHLPLVNISHGNRKKWEKRHACEMFTTGSPSWSRTNALAVNGRPLLPLSYRRIILCYGVEPYTFCPDRPWHFLRRGSALRVLPEKVARRGFAPLSSSRTSHQRSFRRGALVFLKLLGQHYKARFYRLADDCNIAVCAFSWGGWTWTNNMLLQRQLLCQLSYTPKAGQDGFEPPIKASEASVLPLHHHPI